MSQGLISDSLNSAVTINGPPDAPAEVESAVDAAVKLDADTVLLKAPGVAVRDEAEEENRYLIYEPQGDSVLLMNTVGKRVFELCDPSRSLRAIGFEMRKEYVIADDIDLDSVIIGYAQLLLKMNLVAVVATNPSAL